MHQWRMLFQRTVLTLFAVAGIHAQEKPAVFLIGSISLIPFIISSGTGAEIEKPLAIVVVGGLVTRPIKIVILPMVYEWVERRAARTEETALEAKA